MKTKLTLFFLLSLIISTSYGQKISKDKKAIIAALDEKEATYGEVAMDIWQKAEIGFQEYKSCVILQDYLKEASRCLNDDGLLFISETTQSSKLENIRDEIKNLGFEIYKDNEVEDFTFIEARKIVVSE